MPQYSNKKITKSIIDLYYKKDLTEEEIAQKLKISRYIVDYFTHGIGYKQYIARSRGFGYHRSYLKALAKKSCQDYLRDLDKKKGFKAHKERKKIIKNLPNIIVKALKKLDKSQAWLASQVGVSPSIISRYVHRINTPKRNLQEKIFEVLNVNSETLEELLK